MSKQRWLASSVLRARPEGKVDHEQGIIPGISVCTVGEAKGHDVHLDSEFIGRVVELGNEQSHGLKARFGHPNMCDTALGTFLGRFKNFREDGNKARADLFLSNSAKDTPNGDLHSYVMSMAENEPDMFGTSIVFSQGAAYQRGPDGNKMTDPQEWSDDAPMFIECEQLHACDAVDEPAANEGMFSRFSGGTIAGQVTEFLDTHPEIFDAIQGNPEILSAFADHSGRVDGFIERYKAYRATQTGESTMKKTEASAESQGTVVEDTPPVELEDDSTSTVTAAETVAADEQEPDTALDAETSTEEEGATEDAPVTINLSDFQRAVEDFGAELAAAAFTAGGGYNEAQIAHYADLTATNAKLKAENETLRKGIEVKGGKPAVTAAEATEKKKSLFNTTR